MWHYTAGKWYNEDEAGYTLLFTEDPYNLARAAHYPVQVGRLVKMYTNCPSIDYYTIQNEASGSEQKYSIYLIQTTVAKKHKMDIDWISAFLEGIEKQINSNQNQDNKFIKKSLSHDDVTIYLCYWQPVLNQEFEAPNQSYVHEGVTTRGGSGLLRQRLRTKIKVLYGVWNNIKGRDIFAQGASSDQTTPMEQS